MLDFMKATWDHLPPLPKKPRLPPSLMKLRARKAWLSLKPEFEYGDERDQIQRKMSVKAKRELVRDEAWAKAYAKRQKKMDKAKAKQEKGFKILGDSKKANQPSKPTRAATAPAPTAAVKPKPVRAATVPAPGVQPKVVQGWSALQQQPGARPMVHRSPSAPKVIYPTPVRSQPRSKPGMPQVAHRAHVPMRSASHPVPRKAAVAAPKVTVARAQTLPTAPKKR